MSRNEAIIQSIIDGTSYTEKPQSRLEALLLELKEVIETSGGDMKVVETTDEHGGTVVTITGKRSEE